MPRFLTLLTLSLLSVVLLAPAAADAKKKKKKKKGKEPVEEVTPEEKPPSMFEHVSSTDFFGDLKVERYVLKTNQLEVLLIQDPTSDTIAYHTYFDVGSSDEVEGKTGLAHLFEHMMFKRTDKYDDSHFSKTIESNGGPDLNAWTWLDITAYHVSLPKSKLGMIVDLESTRMDGLVIDGEQLDAEREVVINERRFRVDNSPDGAMNEKLWALAFETNRYHWPTIGWQADIEGYTVDDCMAFYKDYYAPNNATVVLAGGFDPEEALATIEAAYKEIPASELRRLEHGDEAVQAEARRADMDLEMASEQALIAFKIPSITHEDRPALTLLDAILTAGASSRLQRRFIDTGWASSAEGWLPPFQHESLYEFSLTMREGKDIEAGLTILNNEIADLQANVVNTEELERARAQYLSGQYEELLSNGGRAGFVGFYEVSMGDWTKGTAGIEAVRTVTAEDVQRVAAKYFVEASRSTIVGHPKEGKRPAKWKAKDLPKIEKPDGELASVVDRPLEGPPPYEAGTVNERETMGWTRLMAYDPALPMVWFTIIVPYGAGVEEADKLGLANVTAELLLRGTQDRDRDSFERTLEGLGASISAGVSADNVTISGSVLSENWPAIASLLSEAFEFPAFDEDEFEALIEEIGAQIVDNRNSDRALARKFYGEALFSPDSRYGRPVLGTETTLAAITMDDVRGHYRKWFTSQGAILALLGDFDAGAGSDLAKVAGKLEGEPEPMAYMGAPVPQGRRLVFVDKPERTQTQMYLGHFFLRPEGETYARSWIANEAYGAGGFGARMMAEVREKRGWSYGAYAWPVHRKDISTYSMWVFPAVKDAIPCLELVLSMYEEFVASGITEEELAYAKGSILNSAAFYKDTPSKKLAYETTLRQTGYDPISLLEAVEASTLEDVNTAAAEAFHPNDMVITIVGTADAEVTLGEGDDATTTTLIEALKGIFGEEAVTVVPFDRE
ncbi:MAG: insulinase family protein [Proteobacteria bacterium]|nr:insulinase family protein [Pseudomonadota bacterium]